MLEFLTTKIAMMVAAAIILISVFGIFSMQREDAKELDLKNISHEISGAINNVNTIIGETRETVTFEEGEEGIYLKPRIEGKAYEIILTRYEVVIRQDDKTFLINLIEDIHLWFPERGIYTSSEIMDLDKEYWKLAFISGENFIIQRKLIEIDGEKGYMTFVYLSRG